MEPAPLAGNITDALPVLDHDDTLAMLLGQSPELAQSRAGVHRARCNWSLQCAERRPNVEVELGEFGYLSLLTAQRTFFTVNIEHLASLGELWAHTIALEGMLLEGGLEAVE